MGGMALDRVRHHLAANDVKAAVPCSTHELSIDERNISRGNSPKMCLSENTWFFCWTSVRALH